MELAAEGGWLGSYRSVLEGWKKTAIGSDFILNKGLRKSGRKKRGKGGKSAIKQQSIPHVHKKKIKKFRLNYLEFFTGKML